MYAYTGGKTGGHIYPLIKLIEESNSNSIYIGYNDSLEEKICKNNNIEFIGLYNEKTKNKYLLAIKGYYYLKSKLEKYDIKAIISSGGYVSIPACLYAIKHKIPLFLLEENLIVGRVNQIFYPFCKKMFLGYELENSKKKYIFSGLPIKKIDSIKPKIEYDILIVGGSLGSKKLCDIALELKNKYKCLLIAGRYYEDYFEYTDMKVIDYSNEIIDLMKKSKIIIARAGAQTSAEIFKVNKPYICIPSLKTSRNHQYINALFFKKKGACIMCNENNMDDIIKGVNNLMNNDNLCINMKKAQNKLVVDDAPKKIINTIKEIINEI